MSEIWSISENLHLWLILVYLLRRRKLSFSRPCCDSASSLYEFLPAQSLYQVWLIFVQYVMYTWLLFYFLNTRNFSSSPASLWLSIFIFMSSSLHNVCTMYDWFSYNTSCMLDCCVFGALPQHFEFFGVSGIGETCTQRYCPKSVPVCCLNTTWFPNASLSLFYSW